MWFFSKGLRFRILLRLDYQTTNPYLSESAFLYSGGCFSIRFKPHQVVASQCPLLYFKHIQSKYLEIQGSWFYYMFVSKGSIHQTYEFISKWHIFKTLVVFAMKYKHIKTSCTCNFNLLLSLKYKQMFIILTTWK